MRLLKRYHSGDISLTEDLADDGMLPSYAILSHTWGADNDEVTFDDLAEGTGKHKLGYEKIQFCAEQAMKDGLEHFWIDTCCINKANKAELSHAISSMFRWYRNAARCYVYLSDVSSTSAVSKETRKLKRDMPMQSSRSEPARSGSETPGPPQWEVDLRKSRWFTRGWTLQELLGPASIEFFSRDRMRIGDKDSLEQLIHEVTGIPRSALRETPLCQFHVKDRFRWIESRETKLEEDRAYSLQGIFDVEIPLRYGEGMANAFKRLEDEIDKVSACIQDICLTDPRDDRRRIEETKGGLLEASYQWILDSSDFQQWREADRSRLLWIKGDPGKGKTMLLCGIIKELEKSITKTELLSYFFCQATDSQINSAVAVLRGLLYMLVDQQPSLVSHVQKQARAGRSSYEGTNAWIVLSNIFTDILQDPSLNLTYLLVDALDECVHEQAKLLDFIVQKSTISTRVKWILTSRNHANIEQKLLLDDSGTRLSLEIKGNAEHVSRAVHAYIEHRLAELPYLQRNPLLQSSIEKIMLLKANGSFLWVSLVMKEIQDALEWEILALLDEVPMELKEIYQRMLSQISTLKRQYPDLCRTVLATVITTYRPLHLQELGVLSNLPGREFDIMQTVENIVKMCGSFLNIREGIVYVIHQSASDFLLGEAYSSIFSSGVGDSHKLILHQSIQIMVKTLRRNIFDLDSLGCQIQEVKQPDPDPLITSRYSCSYWIDHLCEWYYTSSASPNKALRIQDIIEKFLEKNFLYWLEALSLCKNMAKGIASMEKLETLVQNQGDHALCKLVRDASRFILYFNGAIANSPLQAYASALVFSPKNSIVKNHFQKEAPTWLTTKPDLAAEWGACLQSLEGHKNTVKSIAFSHDSKLIASASLDGKIMIWSTNTGVCMKELEGHGNKQSSEVSVAFSHDSTLLVASTGDYSVKIWNINDVSCVKVFEFQTFKRAAFSHPRLSFALSEDSNLLVALYNQNILPHRRNSLVEVWSIKDEKHVHILEDLDYVEAIAFYNSTQLISVSGNGNIYIWDMNNRTYQRIMRAYHSISREIVFSRDKTQIAFVANNGGLEIRDTSRTDSFQILHHNAFLSGPVAFSHNSRRVVASEGTTVIIWNTRTCELLQNLRGHGNTVSAVTFSHDSRKLASASIDGTVMIWDLGNSDCYRTSDDHIDVIRSLELSPCRKWLTSALNNRTVKIWNFESGECHQTLKSDKGIPTITFSHDSKLLAVTDESTTRIWDTHNWSCLKTFQTLSSVAGGYSIFSKNSLLLASLILKFTTIGIFNCNTGECLQILDDHSNHISSMKFSHDSKLLASGSLDSTCNIWDVSSGACLKTFVVERGVKHIVGFSPDSTQLVTASQFLPSLLIIWDIKSGRSIQELVDHNSSGTESVACSGDLTLLASSSEDFTIKIWKVATGDCLQTLRTAKVVHNMSFDATNQYLHTDFGVIRLDISQPISDLLHITTPRYRGWALSPDRKWIVHNSEKMIWLPLEYRPISLIVLEKTIIIGSASGKVQILRLDKPEDGGVRSVLDI